jgi:V/A-type H+-transporting ATPase subunit D
MNFRGSATRMELMKLKKRLALAVMGHHLLKDKQDELVRQFFLRQEAYREHLEAMKPHLEEASLSVDLLRAFSSDDLLSLALRQVAPAGPVTLGSERVLNLSVPNFEWEENRAFPEFGLLDGAGLLEDVVERHRGLAAMLVRKAALEKVMEMILDEIEGTKRRVNALEYKLIPQLTESIRGISAKLSEMELSTLTRLMRVKEIIEGTTRDAGRTQG